MRAGSFRQALAHVLLQCDDSSAASFHERDADDRLRRPVRIMPLTFWSSWSAVRISDDRREYQTFRTADFQVRADGPAFAERGVMDAPVITTPFPHIKSHDVERAALPSRRVRTRFARSSSTGRSGDAGASNASRRLRPRLLAEAGEPEGCGIDNGSRSLNEVCHETARTRTDPEPVTRESRRDEESGQLLHG